MSAVSVYVDGGCWPNPGHGAAGAVVVDEKGFLLELGVDLGDHQEMTNNVAEYRALLLGIRLAHVCAPETVHFVSDSQVVVNQVRGMWIVKDKVLSELHSHAACAIRRFDYWSLSYAPRAQNVRADWLCNKIIRPEDKRAKKDQPVPPFVEGRTINQGWNTMGKKAA